MGAHSFNPVNFLVSLVVGWFVMAFLHSLAVSVFTAAWADLVPRFQAIAFFHDRKAAMIDVLIIVVVGAVTNALWYLARQR